MKPAEKAMGADALKIKASTSLKMWTFTGETQT